MCAEFPNLEIFVLTAKPKAPKPYDHNPNPKPETLIWGGLIVRIGYYNIIMIRNPPKIV